METKTWRLQIIRSLLRCKRAWSCSQCRRVAPNRTSIERFLVAVSIKWKHWSRTGSFRTSTAQARNGASTFGPEVLINPGTLGHLPPSGVQAPCLSVPLASPSHLSNDSKHNILQGSLSKMAILEQYERRPFTLADAGNLKPTGLYLSCGQSFFLQIPAPHRAHP
jgi:hypothetical protein